MMPQIYKMITWNKNNKNNGQDKTITYKMMNGNENDYAKFGNKTIIKLV
jgi:hypothetical protein